MSPKLVVLSSLFAAAVAAPATAQLVQSETLTNWSHLGGAPNWTDDFPHTGSKFGMVDRLNSIDNLQYGGVTPVLQPGTYVAAVRLMKFQDQVGAADIDLIATANGRTEVVQLPVAWQTTDQWVWTPYVIMTLTAPTPIQFILLNSDTTITKQNYYFDEFTIGEVDLGPIVYYDSMTRWGHAHGAPWWIGESQDAGSAAGRVEALAQVWWLEFFDKQVDLAPGLYTANVRFKRLANGSARGMNFDVKIGATSSRVTSPTTDQLPDTFVYTPDLQFVVLPNDVVRFWFGDINSNFLKSGYRFDALIVRSGAYTPYGAGCPASLGPVELTATTPVVDRPFIATVEGVATGGILGFGASKLNLDLSGIGMTGCTLLASFDVVLPLDPPVNGVAQASFQIPALPALVGTRFFNQAAVFDGAANGLGIALSNGGEAEF